MYETEPGPSVAGCCMITGSQLCAVSLPPALQTARTPTANSLDQLGVARGDIREGIEACTYEMILSGKL
jgi:hypothetical protein